MGRPVAVLGLAVLASCATAARPELRSAPTTTAVELTAPTTTSPTTTAPATATVASAVTTPAPTTAAVATPTTAAVTTTSSIVLPVPIAPPPEDGSTDPVVVLGRIEIPAIEIDRELSEGIRLTTLDRGPGHWPGTALPGEVGNVVIAGHRVSHRADFRDLDRLAPGDEVVFTLDAGRFVYRVESTEIVGPDAIRIVDQTLEPTATLFACHPPGSTRERIVVHLRLAP